MKTHHMASIHTQRKSSVVSLDIIHGSWQCGQGVGVDWIFDPLFDCNVNWCHSLHNENLCKSTSVSYHIQMKEKISMVFWQTWL
jgi:hypothetical protein